MNGSDERDEELSQSQSNSFIDDTLSVYNTGKSIYKTAKNSHKSVDDKRSLDSYSKSTSSVEQTKSSSADSKKSPFSNHQGGKKNNVEGPQNVNAADSTLKATSKATTTGAATSKTVGAAGAATAKTAATAGTTAATGVATGGIGALVLGVISLATAGVKAVKKEANSVWEKTSYEESKPKIPLLVLLLLILFLPIILLCLIILTPVAGLTYGAMCIDTDVNEIRSSINTYFEGQTEKAQFLMDELCIDKYDKTAISILDQQRVIDESNIDIYIAIIDKGIDNAFRKKAYSYICTPEIVKGFFTGHSVVETYNNFKNQRYPYTLAHEDGFYYTIGDFLDGKIPEDELNNDVNYAEIICVLSQSKPTTRFSFSEFYDMLMSDEACSLLYEMEMSDRQYFYYNSDGNVVKISVEEINSILEKIRNGEITTSAPPEDESSSSPNTGTPNPNDPLYNVAAGNIFFMYDVKVYPYGLKDLYDICGMDMYDANELVPTMRNIDVLDENEEWLRARLYQTELGPKYNEIRSFYSIVSKAYRESTFLEATGRSLLFYTGDYVNSVSSPGFDYGSGDPNDFEYHYTGQSVILDFPYYINQGNYPNDVRGTDGKGDTIKKSGCTDCSYTMVASYFTRKNLRIQDISKKYVKDNSFQTAQFLKDNNLSERRQKFSVTNICDALIEGKPCVIHISGKWTYNGRVYHSSTRGHFLVIIGFDDNGFYVMDPGSSSNTQSGPIPYAAFSHVDIKTVRPISNNDNSFIPYYKVNTFKEGKHE